jgi:hypothetical protein
MIYDGHVDLVETGRQDDDDNAVWRMDIPLSVTAMD